MKKQLGTTAIWAATLFAFWVLHEAMTGPQNWLYKISPGSVFQLHTDDLKALGVTFATAVFAWASGAIVGYLAALFAAGTMLVKSGNSRLRAFGITVNQIFETAYVVPLVLTVGCAFSFADGVRREVDSPKPLVWLMVVVIGGTALGGYSVYRSMFKAVTEARGDSRYLIASLDFQQNDGRALGRYRQAFADVLRLRDCEILGYCDNLERALHLSIVTVMIIETVIPNIHELLFPSTGQLTEWLGGAGYIVVRAKNFGDPGRIAGLVWAVLIFDHLAVTALGIVTRSRWLRHYEKAK